MQPPRQRAQANHGKQAKEQREQHALLRQQILQHMAAVQRHHWQQIECVDKNQQESGMEKHAVRPRPLVHQQYYAEHQPRQRAGERDNGAIARGNLFFFAKGDAARQRQQQNLHALITQSAHRQPVPAFVQHQHQQ